jgi:hypothetical protein
MMDDCNASALIPLRKSSIAVLSPRLFFSHKFPPDEHKAFNELWSDVTALLKKAEEKPKYPQSESSGEIPYVLFHFAWANSLSVTHALRSPKTGESRRTMNLAAIGQTDVT